jgi:hypothetical protein
MKVVAGKVRDKARASAAAAADGVAASADAAPAAAPGASADAAPAADAAQGGVQADAGGAPSAEKFKVLIDQITTTQDMRYMTASEAMWMLLGFNMHYSMYAVSVFPPNFESERFSDNLNA